MWRKLLEVHMMPMCIICKHYRKYQDRYIDKTGFRHPYCDAYPDGEGIPEAVYRIGHLNPKPGDHGIQFEAREDIDEERLARYYKLRAHEDEDYSNYKPYDPKHYAI